MKTVLAAFVILLLSGCSTMSQWDRQKLLGPEPLAPDAVPYLVTTYNAALATAQSSPRNEQAIADYADASIALTDAACFAWLTRVENAERSLRLGGGGLDVTSGLATTIMGIASAAPIVVGSVGAAFTALAGYGKVLDTAVLTAPSSYVAQVKLTEMMDSAAVEIRKDPGTTWMQAYGKVARYTRLCSYSAIQAAVQDAVTSTTTTVSPNGALKTAPKR